MGGGSSTGELRVIAVTGLPELSAGDPLGALIAERAALEPGDIVVVSQKAVSKCEGRVRRLADVEPGAEARELATRLEKDPALVELILAESAAVLRAERGVLITRTRHGLVCANAGIDSSNLADEGTVALLPEDPDASARRLRTEIAAAARPTGGPLPAVVVADSFGRPWRLGQAEVAIGCAGLTPLDDWRGRRDGSGRELQATAIAVADQIAAAADLVRAKDSGVPAVVVRGLSRFVSAGDGPGAATLLRPPSEDLFL
jgi:coenzyme F420-0:L-glutamate ligase/coenzyme F420-1:gamma-L-glutamate ligase